MILKFQRMKHLRDEALPLNLESLTSRLVVVFLMFVFGVMVRDLHAQVDQGRSTGVITDTTGAVIPKASIDVLDGGTGRKFHASADANGIYTLLPLTMVPTT